MTNSPVKNTPVNTIIETSLVLCDCIREWQDETASMGDGKLDWQAISIKMRDRSGKPVSKLDLQTVWRYIAYGKHFSSNGIEEDSTYSEDEDPFLQPFSAVKRHKIYLSQDRDVSIQQRVYLPPSIPESMDSRSVGRSIKMDIPPHIKHIDGGLQPPQYISSHEILSRGTKPPRNARVSQLAAQGNPELTATLRKTYEPVVMVQVPAGSTYGAKRPELAAQVLGRISENHTHYNAAPPAVQNKLATVAGAWTTGTGPKAVVVAGGVQPNRSSVGSSVSHNCKAPAVPPTASLKRPYSPTKQQLDLNGKLKNVGQHGMAKVPSVDQTLLSVPVPMDCPTVIAAPASATATTSVPLLGVGHSIVSVGQVGDTMPMLAGGASNCAPVQCNAATSSIE